MDRSSAQLVLGLAVLLALYERQTRVLMEQVAKSIDNTNKAIALIAELQSAVVKRDA